MVNEEKPIDQMEQTTASEASDNQFPVEGEAVLPTEEGATVEVMPSEPITGEAELGTDSAVVEEPNPEAEAMPQASADVSLQELDSLRAQLDDRNSQFMRIAADFDNFRRRTQKEREELEVQIKCTTVIELLPVVDNFERARSQIKPQGDEGQAIHKSYQGVYKDLVDRLKRIGVAQMRCEGKDFDPNLHEAILREATAEYEEGTVIEELVRGYTLEERVLRHAMVKVAAPPEDEEPASAEVEENEAAEG
jgi:molecular chaperone GrpE